MGYFGTGLSCFYNLTNTIFEKVICKQNSKFVKYSNFDFDDTMFWIVRLRELSMRIKQFKKSNKLTDMILILLYLDASMGRKCSGCKQQLSRTKKFKTL